MRLLIYLAIYAKKYIEHRLFHVTLQMKPAYLQLIYYFLSFFIYMSTQLFYRSKIIQVQAQGS